MHPPRRSRHRPSPRDRFTLHPRHAILTFNSATLPIASSYASRPTTPLPPCPPMVSFYFTPVPRCPHSSPRVAAAVPALSPRPACRSMGILTTPSNAGRASATLLFGGGPFPPATVPFW